MSSPNTSLTYPRNNDFMHIVPTEEQEFLARTAKDFGADQSPVSRMRSVRENSHLAISLWTDIGALGWIGAHIPERWRGSGLGFAELCYIIEALGRTLTPEPIISSSAVCGGILLRRGNKAHKERYLSAISTGEAISVFAHDEPKARCRDSYCRTSAKKNGGTYILSGTKTPVPDGEVADFMLVSARLEGDETDQNGIGLFIVNPMSEGVSCQPLSRIDGRPASTFVFDKVKVDRKNLIGVSSAENPLITEALDLGRIALSAEMVGGAQAAFDMTIQYLKERVQFGAPIGAFQALQHRAAYLLADLELARSAMLAAAQAVDEDSQQLHEFASLAKATCSEMFTKVVGEGIQMHGGIGVTDEHAMGLYLKRARVAAATWGNATYHRRRWAELRGY